MRQAWPYAALFLPIKENYQQAAFFLALSYAIIVKNRDWPVYIIRTSQNQYP